ncbi:PTS sugar transporter subunit IIA [Lacticaseibacillus pabuli]|uniref:PTS sugar transporter subunit IIA n=1 Tax=Lacticaseibacillus pabuli TaxID=3025672 RepID=A0ABY7WXV2_9LACO|nr:PTS sugar transporter subunit IIA [Lacticaseibacillus sp. KACC 23028]WDF82765.1 PTS sugar transporter subunit IIA [Lacticaseibacillus sp. KACC 23028]
MTNVRLIISGHGKFATGLKGAIALLAKAPDNWQFVDFSEGMSDSDLQSKFEAIIAQDADAETLFFTDLAGGTPYKVAATLANGKKNMSVIAGCNLASLLEIIYSNVDTADALADTMIDISHKAIDKFELAAATPDQSDSDESDGI